MAGMCRHTGRLIGAWEHTVQSMEVIFTTRFHERVMRRWFSSLLPHILGESIVPSTLVRIFAGLVQSLTVKEFNAFLQKYDAREPRFVVTKITPFNNSPETLRQGTFRLRIEGIFRPRAHLGDLTPAGRKHFYLVSNSRRIERLSLSEPA